MKAKVYIRQARGYTLTKARQDALRIGQKAEGMIEDLPRTRRVNQPGAATRWVKRRHGFIVHRP